MDGLALKWGLRSKIWVGPAFIKSISTLAVDVTARKEYDALWENNHREFTGTRDLMERPGVLMGCWTSLS